MSTGFLIINAVFFGVLAVILTRKFFFGGVPYKTVPVWIGSVIWAAYCITRALGV